MKSEEINKDISHFMPQLKQIEEENEQLKRNNMHKDEELINKHQLIS